VPWPLLLGRKGTTSREIWGQTVKIWSTILFAITLSLSGTAALSDTVSLSGFGMLSCTQFGELYRQNPEVMESIFFQWAQGFMSGLNGYLLLSGTPSRDDVTDLGNRSEARQQQAIRSYCDNHAVAKYWQAVEQLYEDMRREQGLPDWRPPGRRLHEVPD